MHSIYYFYSPVHHRTLTIETGKNILYLVVARLFFLPLYLVCARVLVLTSAANLQPFTTLRRLLRGAL